MYDASGNKLSKTVKTGATTDMIQDYVMGVEYNKLAAAARKIEAIYHSEGRYFNTSTTATPTWRTEYTIKDHLGNARLSFTDRNSNGVIDVNTTSNNEILQENHYYAFGERASSSHTKWLVGEVKRSYRPATRLKNERGANSVVKTLCVQPKCFCGMAYEGPWQMNDIVKDNAYQYNGKELQSDHGLNWSDYGERFYDACVGRWTAVDPLAEMYPKWNPYNYALDNPIKLIDRGGLDIYLFFYRLYNLIRIMDDNGTPDDFSDDVFIDEYPAYNNTVERRQIWPDGTYDMEDRRQTRRHQNGDTPNGPYGANGIYRALPFTQANGVRRAGMGVHAGRENRPFEDRLTEGCIRTTPECMDAIQNAIDNLGPLNIVILEEVEPPIIPNGELDPNPIPNFDPRRGPNPGPNPEPRPIMPPIPPLPPIVPNPRPLPPLEIA